MGVRVRHYDHAGDYDRVGRFLVKTHSTAGPHVNWLQPRWEYMHYHPYIARVDLASIGIWETGGAIVGVAHPEHSASPAYFEIDPAYAILKEEMLEYAEQHLSTASDAGRRLSAYINDWDHDFQRLAGERGYRKTDTCEPMSGFAIPDPFPTVSVPEGFALKSLAEDNDLRKLDRVLWRGFGHGDEPPPDGIEDRKFMQSAPNYRHDLNVVVVSPQGDFAAYCGMWYEPVHAVAYVEPVATDPAYRRLGLGRAAVLEGIRRCGELGADVAYVGSAMPFYMSLGFKQVYNRSAWLMEWT